MASFSVLILAAGKATRFKSEHSKVLHRLAGRPLGEYALRAALKARAERTYMIVGHEAEQVRKTFEEVEKPALLPLPASPSSNRNRSSAPATR